MKIEVQIHKEESSKVSYHVWSDSSRTIIIAGLQIRMNEEQDLALRKLLQEKEFWSIPECSRLTVY